MAKWTNLYIPYREVKLLLLFFAVFSLSPDLQNYDITKHNWSITFLVRKRPLEEVEIITAAKEKIRWSNIKTYKACSGTRLGMDG